MANAFPFRPGVKIYFTPIVDTWYRISVICQQDLRKTYEPDQTASTCEGIVIG